MYRKCIKVMININKIFKIKKKFLEFLNYYLSIHPYDLASSSHPHLHHCHLHHCHCHCRCCSS